MCFIDYAKAFDCVSHRKLWETTEQMGVPVHIIQLIANLYKEQESVVRTSNGDTEWFKIERGVRQGCVISPGLYNIYSEHIMRCVLEEHYDGITIGGRRQNNLRFADDTTLILLCTSKEELLVLLKKVKEASKSQNLLLNTQKTKIMVLDKSRERKEDFVLDGENIVLSIWDPLSTSKAVYSAQEIRRRLAMGRGAVQNMVSIWKSRGMSLGLKVTFLRATAFPIAIYGCESWVMTSGDKKRVDAFELWCYRRLLRVSWVERKTNKWVVEKIGSVLMLRKSMAERKMRFFGQVVRKNGMEKRLMQGKVEGKRRRGRPTTAWFQDLKEWTKLNIAAASQLATDRERWREIIKVTAAQIAPPD